MEPALNIAADCDKLRLKLFRTKAYYIEAATSSSREDESNTIFISPSQEIVRYLTANPNILNIDDIKTRAFYLDDESYNIYIDVSQEIAIDLAANPDFKYDYSIKSMSTKVSTISLPDDIGAIRLTESTKYFIPLKNIKPSEISSVLIEYRNFNKVENYLKRYPEINKFINEISSSLKKHFGESVSLVLEVMEYHYDTYYEELVGWIQSTDDVQTGLNMLEQFEDECLQNQIDKVGNKFNFNIEFL